MKCPQCRFENPDDTIYCGRCAAPLRPSGKNISESTKTFFSPNRELARGRTFAGRYEIVEELGKGGMGRVYRAFDKKIKEDVALKLMNPEISADEKTVERFSRELKIARRISHRNVCRMFDLGEEEGTLFISMEYVPGEDLKSMLRRVGCFTVEKALSVAKQICEGLAEAHGLGVVHRDLKPQNVMIDREGNARIMDFGIARSLGGKGITDLGAMIGTPDYMSPEQVDGKEADRRADLYAVGVILYEMLTGRVPFEGDTVLSIALKHKSEAPRDPKEINPQIPDDLCRLILKCMEKEAARRFQSAAELLSELSRVEQGVGATSRAGFPGKPEVKTTGETGRMKSIAVLSFADLSPQKDQEYFCDGMAEELITSLTQINDLRVVARTSAFSFKGKDVDVREIGKKLNVETILEGSVRKGETRMRITAQLINVADGFHLWSERFDRETKDVFDVQDEIAAEIVKKLKINLLGKSPADLVRPHPENIQAYNLYLRGRHFMNKMTLESYHRAIQCFELAIDEFPSYAQAYAGLAVTYFYLAFLDFVPPQEGYVKAEATALKAIDLDPHLSEGHVALGLTMMHYEWDWEGAERALKLALELSPHDSQAHIGYLFYLLSRGRIEDALAESDRIVALDPLSTSVLQWKGLCLLRSGAVDRAVEQFRHVEALEPGRPHTWWLIGHADILGGRPDQGLEEIRTAVDLSKRNPMILAGLGWACAVTGRKSEAEAAVEELKTRSSHEYIRPFLIAKVYAGLGDKDRAFEWLDRAYGQHDGSLIQIAGDETLTGLRGDPRFDELLKKMKLL